MILTGGMSSPFRPIKSKMCIRDRLRVDVDVDLRGAGGKHNLLRAPVLAQPKRELHEFKMCIRDRRKPLAAPLMLNPYPPGRRTLPGAWIETSLYLLGACESSVAPSRVRGLKHDSLLAVEGRCV